jgi:hypothetical protein
MSARRARTELMLNAIGALLAAYLVAGGIMAAADWPHADDWKPWHAPFVGLLAAALYSGLLALYATVQQYRDRRALQDQDATIACQQIAAHLIERCGEIEPTKICVAVWRCRRGGRFAFPARFLLPGRRAVSEITWRKAKGVVGCHWERGASIVVAERLASRNELDAPAIDRLPRDRRLGMRGMDWKRLSSYSAVVSIAEYFGSDKHPWGFLVIDYRGVLRAVDGQDQIDRILELLQHDSYLDLLRSALRERLTRL